MNMSMKKGVTMLVVVAMALTTLAVISQSGDVKGAEGAYAVTGTIVDDVTSEVVSGTTVKVSLVNVTEGIDKSVTTTNGVFTLYTNVRGDYNLTFEADGFSNLMVSLANGTFNDTSREADVGVVLIQPLQMISGTVVDPSDGTGIPDVNVTITNSTGNDVWYVITDDDGHFSKYLSATQVEIVFTKTGYYENETTTTISVSEQLDLGDIEMEMISPSPNKKVSGWVTDDSSGDWIIGATVSIYLSSDKAISTVTGNGGYYELMVYEGSFKMKVESPDYYSKTETFTVTTAEETNKDISLTPIPTKLYTISGNVSDSSTAQPLSGAEVSIYDNTGNYMSSVQTNESGNYTIDYYMGDFTMVVSLKDYFTDKSFTFNESNSNDTKVVTLDAIPYNRTVSGNIRDANTKSAISGATVKIYDEGGLFSESVVSGSPGGFYEASLYDGNFKLLVDAPGYQATIVQVDIDGANVSKAIELLPSGEDKVSTDIVFTDWNTLRIYENKTLEVDNVSMLAEADMEYGTGALFLDENDWVISSGEAASWEADLEEASKSVLDTRDTLNIDGVYYNLDAGTVSLTLSDVVGNIAGGSPIKINAVYNYTSAETIDAASEHSVELNTTYDTEYIGQDYDIYLPDGYELVSSGKMTHVDVSGYNSPVTVDPEVYATDEIVSVKMDVKMSQEGVASAKVVDGLYYILNATDDNYSVIVRKADTTGVDTTVQFSAEDSIDAVGQIDEANFTWDFGSLGTLYGEDVEVNFTTAEVINVNLTITQTGGNMTYADITVEVDGLSPNSGDINVDDSGEGVTLDNGTLYVEEDIPLTFNGTGATDEIVSGVEGIVETWKWSWGDDSNNETVDRSEDNNIDHTFASPGNYTVELSVVDIMGLESTTATLKVVVNDTTPPVIGMEIQNSTGSKMDELTEKESYLFNASTSYDNVDDTDNLTFEWDFDSDGTIDGTGILINHTYDEVSTQNITLVVTDTSGNTDNITVVKRVGLGDRPNLEILGATFKFSPENPSAGEKVTISVNITNKGSAVANNVSIKFYTRSSDEVDELIGTGTLSLNGTTVTSLGVGETGEANFIWETPGKGSYTIFVNGTTDGEHNTTMYDNSYINSQKTTLQVKEPSWYLSAVILGVVAAIIAVVVLIKYLGTRTVKVDDSGKKKRK